VTIVTWKILLVDDYQEDRETYKRYLLRDKQRNYRILEAETGEEALLLCRQQFPDVIVIDYLLPDIDGLELLQELKAEFGKICPPVIILTGRGNEKIAVQAMKGGADDEIELVRELANRIFPRLERARAEAAIAADLQDTQLLRDLSGRLISEDDIQVFYNQIVAGAIALMGADGGTLQILDETTQELMLLATQGCDRTMTEH
jgi:DNA-binding response OmpR family regulator